MKKALVVLMALAMVFSAFADAPAAKCEVTKFSGSASLIWTVDFDDATKTGFKNPTPNADFEFTLAEKGDKTAAGDGAVWGEIKIEGGECKNGFGTATVKTAKLHVGPAAISILGTDVSAAGVATADQGITVEYGIDKVADFKLAFGSDKIVNGSDVDYTSDNYGLGVYTALKAVDGLTANVAFNMKLYNANPWNLEVNLGYAANGVDAALKITKKYSEEFITLVPTVAYYWGDSKVKIDGNEAKPGVSVKTELKRSTHDADDFFDFEGFSLPITINVQDNTFVPNLNWRLYVDFSHLFDSDANATSIRAYADYNLADVNTKVTASTGFGFNKDGATSFGFTVGADYTGIANTTVSVEYASGNLVLKPAKIGTLTTKVTISL